MNKLYLITRRDLSPGYQAVQSVHAAQEFALRFPDAYRHWHRTSNTLALLSVSNTKQLHTLAQQLLAVGIKVAVFVEPDINFGVTAIAVEPGFYAEALVSHLPLALSEYSSSKKRKKR